MNNFRVNVFSSPGLRKDTEYRELGEDAVGFLYEDNQVILWLADGAPGAEIVIDDGSSFGSRSLARYIGECFEETAFENKNIEPKEVFAKSLENVKSMLNDKFEGIFDYLREKKDKLPICQDNEKEFYKLDWSVSFVGGIIDAETMKGCIISAGDCLSILLEDKTRLITNKDGRIFVSWKSPKEMESFEIEMVENSTVHNVNTINGIILMSDGVASPGDFSDLSFDDIWKKSKTISKKTDDDKTLLLFKMGVEL